MRVLDHDPALAPAMQQYKRVAEIIPISCKDPCRCTCLPLAGGSTMADLLSVLANPRALATGQGEPPWQDDPAHWIDFTVALLQQAGP